MARIRTAGAVAFGADAAQAGATLRRLGADAGRRRLQDLADWVVHSAPPPPDGKPANGSVVDPVTRAWTAKLLTRHGRARQPQGGMRRGEMRRIGAVARIGARIGAVANACVSAKRLIYLSTSGVYGDRQGRLVDEASSVRPITDRARRRVAAEQWLRRVGSRSKRLEVTLLRVPGIYALDRLPIKRLQEALPALLPQDDVQTNHIHADDLARLTRVALLRRRVQRTLNIVDDSRLAMGDYLDLIAHWAGLPLPPRIDRLALLSTVSPMRASFMSESRQLANLRMKRELRLPLRHPTVADFLASQQPPDRGSTAAYIMRPKPV